MDPGRHSPGYASEFRFSSAQTEELEAEAEAAHASLRGVRPAEAEEGYLEKVKWLDMYGVDLHPVLVRSCFFKNVLLFAIFCFSEMPTVFKGMGDTKTARHQEEKSQWGRGQRKSNKKATPPPLSTAAVYGIGLRKEGRRDREWAA